MDPQVASFWQFALGCLFCPTDIPQLTIYYLCWIIGFVLINIIWDIRSSKTPRFHIVNLREKINVLHNAAAFSSIFLIIIGLISPNVEKIAHDTIVPLLLAAAAGMFMTIPAICPYPIGTKDAVANNP